MTGSSHNNYGTVRSNNNNNNENVINEDYSEIPHDDDYREQFPSMGNLVKRSAQSCCSAKMLKRRIPVASWAPKYKTKFLFEDLVAGITVGLTAIPQGIAYAVVAGLPPQYGLYSGFMGSFMYIFFGSCKATTIGPTAIMALMTQPYITGKSPDFAVLLAFLSGIITLILGLLNLGFLVQFISTSVISGFTTAAAITIASGQIKSLLGLPGKGTEFLEAWENFFKNVKYTKWQDATLGISSIVVLLLLKKCGEHRGRWRSLAKYISLSRNAIIVFAGVLIAYLFDINGMVPFQLTGEIARGFPPFTLPPFSTTVNNETIGFSAMLSELGSATIAIPLISILETVTIATIFCEKGSAVDATQEMIACGLCNIVNSFVSAMPTTGSFTRSAVNHSSGVRSPLSGLFTGGLVLMALGLLTSTFYYIPKSTLAAVIIAAMFGMVEFHEIWETFKTKRIDVIPILVTLFACLFIGLEYGILVGVGVNLLMVLLSSSRPTIDLEHSIVGEHELLLVTPKQNLIFTCADFFRYKTVKYVVQNRHVDWIAINGEYIQNVDMTAMKKLANMIDSLQDQGKNVVLWNWNHKAAFNMVMRYRSDLRNLFKFSVNSDDLIFQLKSDVKSPNNNHVSDVITR